MLNLTSAGQPHRTRAHADRKVFHCFGVGKMSARLDFVEMKVTKIQMQSRLNRQKKKNSEKSQWQSERRSKDRWVFELNFVCIISRSLSWQIPSFNLFCWPNVFFFRTQNRLSNSENFGSEIKVSWQFEIRAIQNE